MPTTGEPLTDHEIEARLAALETIAQLLISVATENPDVRARFAEFASVLEAPPAVTPLGAAHNMGVFLEARRRAADHLRKGDAEIAPRYGE